ncbi:hypothetical protein ATCC90586_003997 [Pythium insidiosum]|nr:hypothetical protein ATCC90586_003997 [Pythium insidiosum]
MSSRPRTRIAVVGGGISGLASAWLLQHSTNCDVVLFEESLEAGGHAMTVDIELKERSCETPVPVSVDVGFQVFNLTTYPHLVGFFETLGVTSQPSDMSFGCSVPLSPDNNRFEWSSVRNLATIFPESIDLVDSRRFDLLRDVLRFERHAPQFLLEIDRGLHRSMTVAEFLLHFGYSPTFRDAYMVPMIAAIWSLPRAQSMRMPMRTLIRFMVNHHLHRIKNRPKWRTVVDRSRQYVQKVVRDLHDVRLGARVVAVKRDDAASEVELTLADGSTELFDEVVLATHADISLELLGDGATDEERDLLGCIEYQANRCVLHTDPSIMPTNRKLWASWNVKEFQRLDVAATQPICCSYWVNRLQNLPDGVEDVFVTLNPPHELKNTLLSFDMSHPVLNSAAIDAQERLPSIQGQRHIYFAGAWTRYGFHEDGILSAVSVLEALQLSRAKIPWIPRSPSPIPPSRLARACLGLFDTYATKSVTVGSLRLLLPDGSERMYAASHGEAVASRALHSYLGIDLNDVTIQLQVHDLEMFPRIVFGHSSIAMAEAYMDQKFDLTFEDRTSRRRLKLPGVASSADDRLALFLYWCALNLNKIEANTSLLGGPAQLIGRKIKALHHYWRQFNTISQAKRHIAMHYDLGNDLYELFLDPSMTYSSGMFPLEFTETTLSFDGISETLEQEQSTKIKHAFHAADIRDGHRVLEIGCGWGSMAIYACSNAECRWTALTLSREQQSLMEERVRAAGLQDRIEVLLADFRELVESSSYRASFDRVVSLEMIEALGDRNLPVYFAHIRQFLKPDVGRVCIQAITIPDDRYDQYCRNTDFIKEYIFPGGHLPSRARIYWAIQEGNATVERENTSISTALTLTQECAFGRAYASTLRAWRLRLLYNQGKILALRDGASKMKYDARFIRMFEWYFAYCEVGFQQGLIDVVQIVLENRRNVSPSIGIDGAHLRMKPFQVWDSRILTGSVFHGRYDGHANAFRYDTVMMLLSLNDLYLCQLFKDRWYFSINSPNLLAFHRRDHFGDPKQTLRSCVLQRIQEDTGENLSTLEGSIDKVFLLTTIRCMGYCFNPISIFYCMSSDDPSRCLFVVLEVTNTPWLEKHCYVLRVSDESVVGADGLMDVRFTKELHVSPFFKMDCEYRIRLNHPGQLTESTSELRVLLELHDIPTSANQDKVESQEEPEPEQSSGEKVVKPLGKKLFTASIKLRDHSSYETTDKSTGELQLVLSMMLMAWKAQLLIHYQALKLVFMGQRIFKVRHPAYTGKLRATVLYSLDLVKHVVVFGVAIIGLSLMELAKQSAERPGVTFLAITALAAGILCSSH